jgi:hypothetical protein
MTADQITAACQRLEDEEFICYWCGVELTFLQESGYSQFSPDRLFDKQYFEVGQRTVRSCIHCQYLFCDATMVQREFFIDELLSPDYRPDLADRALDLFESGINDDDARLFGQEIIKRFGLRSMITSQSRNEKLGLLPTGLISLKIFEIGRRKIAASLGDC